MSSSTVNSKKTYKGLFKLSSPQKKASDPDLHAWLSASAGSGKTQVLTSRVFRLLYRGVDPASILCLTYTKAGAAEMANRINATLARWVRLDNDHLAADLEALGESISPSSVEHARTLFARVLDVPGGLRIQTIHSFAQSLLGSFPVEAGLVPGFELVEGEAQRALVEEAIGIALDSIIFIQDIENISRRMGADEARRYLTRCAQDGAAFHKLGPEELIADRIWRGLDLRPGTDEVAELPRFEDGFIDLHGLRSLATICAGIKGKTGPGVADALIRFLGREPSERMIAWRDVQKVILTKEGNLNQHVRKLPEKEPSIGDALHRLAAWLEETENRFARYRLARDLLAAFRGGAVVARRYRELKHARALVDFNDLIYHLHDLLTRQGMGEWVRFKLDQQTDHVLIDEAQDTNQRQWDIIEALTEEYFAGEGAVGRARSLFVVGDFKQAIFSFQGTNPAAFRDAQERFTNKAHAAGKPFEDLSLDTSYRSLSSVLACVDAVLGDQGARALGIESEINPHASFRPKLGGNVFLWKPVSLDDLQTEDLPGLASNVTDDDIGDEDSGDSIDVDDGKRGAEALLARRLAAQIQRWLYDEPLYLDHQARFVQPGDIMILLRNRGFLARQIIARLHDLNIPVAGIDRMHLQNVLAVKDLLAAMRFAVLPDDDLNLAALLVSPLFGLTQDDLFELAWKRQANLWRSLRGRREARFEVAREGLESLLAMADLVSPHDFFERLLSGPIRGRAKMIARLGLEVLDPIEELLVSALDLERQGFAQFVSFLAAMDRAEDEIKREQEGPQHQVRLMTAHGSKGLQAPVVILADATSDPDDRREALTLYAVEDDVDPVAAPLGSSKRPCHERVSAAYTSAKASRDEEHRRLLYVALTRAEEVLCLGGAMGKQSKSSAVNRWHDIVRSALETVLEITPQSDSIWGQIWRYGEDVPSKRYDVSAQSLTARPVAPVLPEWIDSLAPEEARPPRPLAPSQLGIDLVVDPPGDDPRAEAMLRGTLLHGLFERLPGVARERQAALADAWLIGHAGDRTASWRQSLVAQAMAIIDKPAHAALFGPDSLAEVPLSAVVGEKVISGVVDRIRITDDTVEFVDFKTGRRVPTAPDAISNHHVRQMAAYRDALRVIFPGRVVRASLLYTSGPTLFELADAQLDTASGEAESGQ